MVNRAEDNVSLNTDITASGHGFPQVLGMRRGAVVVFARFNSELVIKADESPQSSAARTEFRLDSQPALSSVIRGVALVAGILRLSWIYILKC